MILRNAVLLVLASLGASFAFAQNPPVRPKPPMIQDRDWIQIPLDAFVLSRLETAGLKPMPEASRPELLRRLTLSLAGRAATAAEIDAFVASRDKRAYEKEVDRLFDSSGLLARFAEVARLYAAGWDLGSPGRPGVRVHFPGTRQERLVSPDEVFVRHRDSP